MHVSIDGTTLQKTSGCDGCDDAGARSEEQIDSPGGYVEFTVGEANTFWIGGLSNGNGGPSCSGIDYATQATTLMRFQPLFTSDGGKVVSRVVHFNDLSSEDGGAANHVSHTNAKKDVPPEQQYACASNAQHASRSPHIDDIVCFMLNADRNPPVGDPAESPLDVLVVAPVMTNLDDGTGTIDADADYQRRPKGNLDVNGDYFIWTTNMGATSNRSTRSS